MKEFTDTKVSRAEPTALVCIVEQRCVKCGAFVSAENIWHGAFGGTTCSGRGGGRRRLTTLIEDGTTLRRLTALERRDFRAAQLDLESACRKTGHGHTSCLTGRI